MSTKYLLSLILLLQACGGRVDGGPDQPFQTPGPTSICREGELPITLERLTPQLREELEGCRMLDPTKWCCPTV